MSYDETMNEKNENWEIEEIDRWRKTSKEKVWVLGS